MSANDDKDLLGPFNKLRDEWLEYIHEMDAGILRLGLTQRPPTDATRELANARVEMARRHHIQLCEAITHARAHAGEAILSARVEGFELAHELQDCGHSRGDCRDPNYKPGDEFCDSQCIGCQREARLKSDTIDACLRAARRGFESGDKRTPVHIRVEARIKALDKGEK